MNTLPGLELLFFLIVGERMAIVEVLNGCVACGGKKLALVLDLGYQPLANDYLPSGNSLEEFPLALNRCESCYHAQLSHSVNPERLFRNYSYVSGTSKTLFNYFEILRDKIFSRHGTAGKILDVGSNDGTFLSVFKDTNWNCLGVDPAINLVAESAKLGVLTLPSFFNVPTAKLLASDFDVVVAMNVFAHSPNPLEVLQAIKLVLAESGTAYIQTSQANMFENGEFDTVYHEHISFFNVKSMKSLLSRVGLHLNDVEFVSVHGNSYLWVISHREESSDSVRERENYETQLGLYGNSKYEEFAATAHSRVEQVREVINDFRAKGFGIASYGAAAKGNTFINFGQFSLDYIYDDTPLKIGMQSPAGGSIVSNPDQMCSVEQPLLFVIPAWNFRDEILSNIRRRRSERNDSTLTYFPQLRLEQLF